MCKSKLKPETTLQIEYIIFGNTFIEEGKILKNRLD